MKLFLSGLLILIAAYAIGVVDFDPNRKLIDDVVLVREGDSNFLQLNFSAPVRIIGSFPESTGNILQIKLRVIAFGRFEENVSLLEEYVGIEEGKELNITDMYYEGNVPGGPFIVMRFSQPAQWKVTESDSLMGLSIEIKSS